MHTSSLDILQSSLLSPPQAKAILQVMELELSAHHESLATKADLLATASDLKATASDLKAAFSDLKADFSDLKVELKGEFSRLELKIEAGRVDNLRWIVASNGVMLGAFYFFLNYVRK